MFRNPHSLYFDAYIKVYVLGTVPFHDIILEYKRLHSSAILRTKMNLYILYNSYWLDNIYFNNDYSLIFNLY